MTANELSSAPARTELEYESDNESKHARAARHTEEFLANMLYEVHTQGDENYLPSNDGPVRVTANMISGEEFWILSDVDGKRDTPPKNTPPTLPGTNATSPSPYAKSPATTHAQTTNTGISSSFFDDSYTDGKLCKPAAAIPQPGHYHPVLSPGRYPHNSYRQALAVNPSERPTETHLSYLDAFQADLTTIQDVAWHESRIYQHGYTPDNIRHNLREILSNLRPEDHLVEFQQKDIPPAEIDPDTIMVLYALLEERTKADSALFLSLKNESADGAKLDPHRDTDAEYQQWDKAHNDANRSMYQIYSDSVFLIHDNNFLSYCKPHLRNLPIQTALELQNLKDTLNDKTPYRPIQKDALPAPTVPIFKTLLGQQANTTQLKPRAQWMKDTPPHTSDKDADHTYNAACSWMFGTEEPPTSHTDIPASPDTLRRTILQSRQASAAASATTTPYELPTNLGAMEGSSSNDMTRPAAKLANALIVDVRNPLHPKHSEAQALRSKIITALESEPNPLGLPCPGSHTYRGTSIYTQSPHAAPPTTR